jgi:ribosome-associated protein
MHDDKIDWDEYYGGPSRSMERRDALDVLQLAKDLVALSERELARIPLSEALRDHVLGAQRITANVAHKRQVQFLAKQIRKHDDELPVIRAALDAPKVERRRAASALHRIEEWRDRLLRDGDDAINDLLAALPSADRQQIRQLVRGARAEAAAGKPPAAARQLFRAIQAAYGEAIEPRPGEEVIGEVFDVEAPKDE